MTAGANSSTRQWLLDWIGKTSSYSHKDLEKCTHLDYLHEGFLESIALVELIMEIEEAFKIEFNEDHFNSLKFSTIDGLSELIDQML